jgi:acetolactate synthase I/III small subunit
MDQVIHVRLENKPGALMRVAGILTATGTNIESLVLSPDACDPGVSNMTIVADIEPRLRERVVQQMNRLVNVFVASDITPAASGAELRDEDTVPAPVHAMAADASGPAVV